jgi:hypothetical protein
MDLPQCAGFNAGGKRKVTIIPLAGICRPFGRNTPNYGTKRSITGMTGSISKSQCEPTARMATLGPVTHWRNFVPLIAASVSNSVPLSHSRRRLVLDSRILSKRSVTTETEEQNRKGRNENTK